MESPTGCTKQLISVAVSEVPAAELMRPAGMKPRSCGSRNSLPSGRACLGLGRGERPRDTRAQLRAVVSPSLAYFSSRTSREIACSAGFARARGLRLVP
jgi:hypothetical protein